MEFSLCAFYIIYACDLFFYNSGLVEAILMAAASEQFIALFLVLLQSSTNVLTAENCLPSDSSFCRCSTRNITLDISQIGLSYP